MTVSTRDLIKAKRFLVTTDGNTDCWGNVHKIDCGAFTLRIDAERQAERLAEAHGSRTYHVHDPDGMVIASYR